MMMNDDSGSLDVSQHYPYVHELEGGIELETISARHYDILNQWAIQRMQR